VTELIQDIGHRRGLGAELADGTKRLAAKYGGNDFAMHVKGLELSAYDPRVRLRRASSTPHQPRRMSRAGREHVHGVGRPLTINPQNLKLKADIPIMQQNIACAIQLDGAVHLHTYG